MGHSISYKADYEIVGKINLLYSGNVTAGGLIIIECNVDDKEITFIVSVNAEQYQIAIDAHANGREVSVKGNECSLLSQGYLLKNVEYIKICDD